jgi:hypothetical protein
MQRPQKLLFPRFATSKVCNRYPTMAQISGHACARTRSPLTLAELFSDAAATGLVERVCPWDEDETQARLRRD